MLRGLFVYCRQTLVRGGVTMQTTEQRLKRLEKHNRRLTTALTITVAAMCAAVTMAADEMEEGYVTFDTVFAKRI